MISTTLLILAIAADIYSDKRSRNELQEAIDAGLYPRVGDWYNVGPWGAVTFGLWIAAGISLLLGIFIETPLL